MRRTKKEMQAIVKDYARHSGTKREFCNRHNLKMHVLDYWRRKLGEEGSRESGNFVELPLSPSGISSYYRLHTPKGLLLELPVSTPIKVLEKLLQSSLQDV